MGVYLASVGMETLSPHLNLIGLVRMLDNLMKERENIKKKIRAHKQINPPV